MERFTGLLGLVVILYWGLGLQFGFAFLVLRTNVGYVFQAASNGVNHMLEYATESSAAS